MWSLRCLCLYSIGFKFKKVHAHIGALLAFRASFTPWPSGPSDGHVQPVDHEAPSAVVVAQPSGAETGEEILVPAFRTLR